MGDLRVQAALAMIEHTASRAEFVCALRPSTHLLSSGPASQAGDGKPVSDQWLPPFVIVDDDKKPVGTVEDGDAVVGGPASPYSGLGPCRAQLRVSVSPTTRTVPWAVGPGLSM
jgi:hypothetical protein